MDRFSKTCLLLIVIFLAIIALRPVLTAQPVQAAPSYVYAATPIPGSDLGVKLTEMSAKGTEIFAVVPGGGNNAYVVIGRSLRDSAPAINEKTK
jgi:hypothetical protein